jgi:hypothetical protein
VIGLGRGMMLLAPVVLFAYNRVDHLKATLNSLSENELAINTEVFVFVDGPKNSIDSEKQNLILQDLDSGIGKKFKTFTVKVSTQNRGLANSIISGVSEIVNRFGRIIVLEDDLVTSRHFLAFMNQALDRYENEDRVVSIHGYVYPFKTPLQAPFFLRGADCWGWATWSRGWKLFEPDGKMLLDLLTERKLKKEFNYDGNYNFIQMLKDQIAGKNNSWAIRWHASAFLKDKLTLYPNFSLVKNIGLDGSGTHCDPTTDYQVEFFDGKLEKLPDIIEPSISGYRAMCSFYKEKKPHFLKRVFRKLRRYL